MPNTEDVGQLELSYMAGGSVKWYNHSKTVTKMFIVALFI